MKRLLAFGALLLALTQTGCGTVKNFQRESFTDATPYGGVEIAAEQFKPGLKNCGAPTALAWPVYATDVAASAIGDTLTLPITVPLAIVSTIVSSNLCFFPGETQAEKEWRLWLNSLPECASPAAPPVK